MDFIALKAAAARDIALAFGVPPMLLGLPGDATYANYREANRALWRQTILPLAGKLLSAIAQGLGRTFPGATLNVDLDRVTELSEDRERLWAQVNTAGFLTLDEKREAVGLEALALAVGDVAPEAESGEEPDVKPEGEDDQLEVKYNHNHDPRNGQFTFAPGGAGPVSSGTGLTSSVGRSAPSLRGQVIALASGSPSRSGGSVTIPLAPPTPTTNEPATGTRRLPHGGVSVPLGPPSSPPKAKSYSTAKGISVPEAIEPQVEAIAVDFEEMMNAQFKVSSGLRPPARQAAAMYAKFRKGSSGSEYTNKAAVTEIRQAYVNGREAKASRTEIVASMQKVIDEQVKKGTYISLHMTGRAVDLKVNPRSLTKAQLARLTRTAAANGGILIGEGKPPHIHIQFPIPPAEKVPTKR